MICKIFISNTFKKTAGQQIFEEWCSLPLVYWKIYWKVVCFGVGHCSMRQPGADWPPAHLLFVPGTPVANAHSYGVKITEARSHDTGQSWRYIVSRPSLHPLLGCCRHHGMGLTPVNLHIWPSCAILPAIWLKNTADCYKS